MIQSPSPKKVSSLFNNGVFGNSSPGSLTQLAVTPSGSVLSSPKFNITEPEISSPGLNDQSSLPKVPETPASTSPTVSLPPSSPLPIIPLDDISLTPKPFTVPNTPTSVPTSPLPMPPPGVIEISRLPSPQPIVISSPQVKPQQAKSVLPSPPALSEFSPMPPANILPPPTRLQRFDSMALPETPAISVPTPFQYTTPIAVAEQLPLEETIPLVPQQKSLTFIANDELLSGTINPDVINTPLINIEETIDDGDIDTNIVEIVTDELTKKGFTITHKLYDGNKVVSLLVTSKNGDLVLIEVDSENYQPSINKIFSANDILLSKSKGDGSQMGYEHKTKMLSTLNNTFCGTAYICNNNICIVKYGGTDTGIKQSEWNFENPTDIDGSDGRTSVPYLTVPLSVVSGTEVTESELDKYITEKSRQLTELTFDDIEMKIEILFKTFNKLGTEIHAVPKAINFLRKRLDETIIVLEKDFRTAPNPAIKGEILKSLQEKKLLRLRLANKLIIIDKFTRMLKGVSDEILEMMNPILQEIGTKIEK